MNADQYTRFRAEQTPAPVKTSEFAGERRLLMHGYNLDRQNVYVIFDPVLGIGRLVGDHTTPRLTGPDAVGLDVLVDLAEFRDEWPVEALRASKRSFPARTDLHFARLMRERHEYGLSFTAFVEDDALMVA